MAIGLFGKLPCEGDFISRRLPWEFTSAWDEWLQSGLSQAKGTIGDGWNQTYLTAPLWRFQLQPGVIGPNGWIGIWFASVDRVGRQFPLALVEALPTSWAGRYAVLEQDEAFFAVEDAALRGLDPRLGFADFDRSLEGLSLLSEVAAAPQAVMQVVELETPGELQSGAAAGALAGAAILKFPADADAAFSQRCAEQAGPANSCFFTWGNEQHAPMLYRSDGLIADKDFRGFIDGRWPAGIAQDCNP